MFYLFDSKPQSASFNMALDEYLFNFCRKKPHTFLRFYKWEKPSFSIGVSQNINKVLDIEYIKEKKHDYVRRITGGKAVLHDNELTYSVISSDDLFFKENDLHKSYLLISKILVKGLKNLGIQAYLHKNNDPVLAKSNNPCFSFPTPNEIEIDGKKIIGSAQKRNNQALLQHGSIPFTMNYLLYAQGTKSREGIIKRAMTCVNDVSNVTKKEVANSLLKEFENFTGNKQCEFEENYQVDPDFKKLLEKYKSNDWNFVK